MLPATPSETPKNCPPSSQESLVDLVFRLCFSSIFIGLGAEHIVSDDLIQNLMPGWMPYPRAASLAAGVILVSGGVSLALGYRIRLAAIMLAAFLITVTAFVHAPALFSSPDQLPGEWQWIWTILQRSNFVKNMCLFGVCLRLMHYDMGRWCLESYLKSKARRS